MIDLRSTFIDNNDFSSGATTSESDASGGAWKQRRQFADYERQFIDYKQQFVDYKQKFVEHEQQFVDY
jgi:hypothetical protein